MATADVHLGMKFSSYPSVREILSENRFKALEKVVAEATTVPDTTPGSDAKPLSDGSQATDAASGEDAKTTEDNTGTNSVSTESPVCTLWRLTGCDKPLSVHNRT